MIIHVVQSGETANDIAEKYGVSVDRLILENNIQNPNNLLIGETLVVLKPEVIHIVQEGDTLYGIANSYGTSVLQLLRNNPYLSNREYIYPGDVIIIKYEGEKLRSISTYGFAYPFINTNTLRKTLPYLTYITVYSYYFNEEGRINELNDTNIIKLALEYHVAPIMTLIVEDIDHNIVSNTLQNFLKSKESQEVFFNNVINILSTKGYQGVNLNIPYIFPENRENFVDFIVRFSSLLEKQGYSFLFNTLSIKAFEIMADIIYEGFDYSKLLQSVDGLLLMTYEWGNFAEIPTGIINFDKRMHFVSERAERYTAEKIFLGIPIIGYVWELPVVVGVSKGLAIAHDTAVKLAKEMGIPIQYDNLTKTAHFRYTTFREYVVRFRDSRTIYEYLYFVNELGLKGISIWNIMIFYPQLWLLVNSLFKIDNIYEDEDPS
jgi:spore germination protein